MRSRAFGSSSNLREHSAVCRSFNLSILLANYARFSPPFGTFRVAMLVCVKRSRKFQFSRFDFFNAYFSFSENTMPTYAEIAQFEEESERGPHAAHIADGAPRRLKLGLERMRSHAPQDALDPVLREYAEREWTNAALGVLAAHRDVLQRYTSAAFAPSTSMDDDECAAFDVVELHCHTAFMRYVRERYAEINRRVDDLHALGELCRPPNEQASRARVWSILRSNARAFLVRKTWPNYLRVCQVRAIDVRIESRASAQRGVFRQACAPLEAFACRIRRVSGRNRAILARRCRARISTSNGRT